MIQTPIIRRLQPWQINLREVGPFREGVKRVSLRSPNDNPFDLYLLAAGNGQGKTTILEAMYFLFRMLWLDFPDEQDLAHDYFDERSPQVQFDLLLHLEFALTPESPSVERKFLLSLSWGDVGSSGISGWQHSPLESVEADYWLRYGWARSPGKGQAYPMIMELIEEAETAADELLISQLPGGAEDIIKGLRELIREGMEEKPSTTAESESPWTGVRHNNPPALPTVLYFTAGRDLVRNESKEYTLGRPSTRRYSTAFRFDRDGFAWSDSLDNLLVWLYWIGKDDFEHVRDEINRLVFGGREGKFIEPEPLKDPPRIKVRNLGRTHALDRLSSGERVLVQFALRYAAHRTKYTILLIDEVEAHLHPEYQARLMEMLKQIAKNVGTTVIFTTHSLTMLREFRNQDLDAGLHKGGEIRLGG